MPFIGLSPFLQCCTGATTIIKLMCQCPLSGFLHFYMTNFKTILGAKCVNALYRAFSISTQIYWKQIYCSMLVSMPFIGLSPFLLGRYKQYVDVRYGCQCPLSGFLHFYTDIFRRWQQKRIVSMPFIGLSPFLRRLGDVI